MQCFTIWHGAVLSHTFPDGMEAPIAYYSRTLFASEYNYSQLDWEVLTAVTGINCLYGCFFTLITDHKPLLGLLAGDRQTPQILSPHMSHWAEFLSTYFYWLVYKPGSAIGHTDALSHWPLPAPAQDPVPAASVLLIEELNSPISALDISIQPPYFAGS